MNIKCTKCKKTKHSDRFYKSSGSKSGYTNQCKQCQIESASRHNAKKKRDRIGVYLDPRVYIAHEQLAKNFKKVYGGVSFVDEQFQKFL